MTESSSNMLSIHASGSLLGENDGTEIDLGKRHSGYTHTIQAEGGYWTAGFGISCNQQDAEEWLDRGLGRHIAVYNPSLQLVWEGYVDKLSISLGRLSVTRGPLTDLANRVWSAYAPSDTATTIPTIGVRTLTDPINNTDSQSKYGIWECVLSGGSVPASEVDAMQETYLAENAWPVISQELGASGSAPSVKLDCKGYAQLFDQYYYQNYGTGLDDLTVKLVDIIDSDPNGIFSSANADITENTLSIAVRDDADRMAWSALKELLAAGDANDLRYLFGVYANRHIVYAPMPNEIEYTQRLHDPAQRIEDMAGVVIDPWDVLPGKWLFMPDFLIGRTQVQTLRFDPRYLFVESVTYNEPYGVQLKGGRIETFSRKLARLGLLGGT